MAWNQAHTNAAPKKRPAPAGRRGLFAGLIVVIAGLVAVLLLRSSASKPDGRSSQSARTKRARSVRTMVATNAVAAMRKAAETNAAERLPPWEDRFVADRQKRMAYSTLIEARTNGAGMVTERFKLPNGKTWRRVTDPPPLFKNASDCAIAMSLGDRSGAPIPPVPGLNDANLDEEFVKSLEQEIAIDPKDSPRVVALKMAVQSVRNEIAELRKNGDTRSIGQILADHIALNNHRADLQGQALAQVEQVRRESGDEAAAEYLEKVNAMLKTYGVEPVGKGRRRGKREEVRE